MKATISLPAGLAYGADSPPFATPVGADPLAAVAEMLRGDVDRVAKLIGMPISTLQKKLSLTNDTHHLYVSDLLMIQNATGLMAGTEALAAAGGCICIREYPRRASSVAEGLTTMMVMVAELARAINDAGGSGRGVTTHERRRIQSCLAEALGACNAAAASVQHVQPTGGHAA